MAKLFLSSSRTDAQKARRLTEWLQREDHEVWRDEDDIGGGTSFSSEIEKALKDCDAVLVLWSKASVQSAWVRDEAAYGRDTGKLLPISLDGAEPPLGFREFQSIDVSKWKAKGPPANAGRLRLAIERIAGGSEAIRQTPAAQILSSRAATRSAVVPLAAAAILCLAILGLLAWKENQAEPGITIAVFASSNSPDASAAADYANVAAADLASYLPARFEGATVIGPGDVDTRMGGYRIQIAAGHRRDEADASLTIADRDGRSILWSKSWSVPDGSAVGLRERVSQAVSQAALCLAKARGGATRLEQPALGLFISSCTGLFDPKISLAQLEATSEKVVKLAPNFAQGWAGVAMGRAIDVESQQDRTGFLDPAALKRARKAILTLRNLDPHSGIPYLAEWHLLRDDPVRGLAVLNKGIEVDPDEPALYARLSNALMSLGRMNDAVEAAHRAVEVEPIWSFTRASYINALTYAGQISRAEADIAEARQKWPNNAEIDSADFDYQYRYGDARKADELLPRVISDSDLQLMPYRDVISARLDPSPSKVNRAIAAVASANRSDPHQRNAYLLTLATFGRSEEVYRLLGNGPAPHSFSSDLLFRPEFAPVRHDPRFMQVAARFGLVRYWRQSGSWPDFCANEELPYDCRTEAAKYH